MKLPKIHLILCKNSHRDKISWNENDHGKYLKSIYEIYVKHPDAFDQNFVKNPTEIENEKNFFQRFVLQIDEESNVVSRLAVRSHSPLLTVKKQHADRHDVQISAQTFDKALTEIVERIS